MPRQARLAVRELYIYYRVAAVAAERVQREVQAMIESLGSAQPGLRARVLRRPGRVDEVQTWMEIWTHPAGIDAQTQAEIEARAASLLPLLDGTRHVEVFEPLGAPATHD